MIATYYAQPEWLNVFGYLIAGAVVVATIARVCMYGYLKVLKRQHRLEIGDGRFSDPGLIDWEPDWRWPGDR